MKKTDYIESKKNLFIAANPLQILISISIIKQLGISNESILLIHGEFTSSKEIAKNLAQEKNITNNIDIAYSKSRHDAFLFAKKIKPHSIFIDGDVGFKNFKYLYSLKILNKELKINVFEEGNGTYRNDLYQGTKRWFFDMLGIGVFFGGCTLTSFVYVTNPDKYKQIFPRRTSTIKKITNGPYDILSHDYDLWIKIFNYKKIEKIRSNECNIYLTNWNFKKEHIEKIFEFNGDNYIKLHPRCKDEVNIENITTINTGAPAEIVINDISLKYNYVRVFHHGSSVSQYFSKPNVEFIKI